MVLVRAGGIYHRFSSRPSDLAGYPSRVQEFGDNEILHHIRCITYPRDSNHDYDNFPIHLRVELYPKI